MGEELCNGTLQQLRVKVDTLHETAWGHAGQPYIDATILQALVIHGCSVICHTSGRVERITSSYDRAARLQPKSFSMPFT
jgi:hypothetical protein